ncbi:Carboxypeptidase Y like protein A [Lasiodiplodia theobromae]|uniref:Carboxypeptidase Y like protein A n=1 Tax=Lasiodiplodia theobromae TaxID=45133 RepID=A0A8H7MAT7_9PEZI|nr:Carboxypeptidase Y like protein A [Lasiodiplodia theobromae]
MFKEIGPCYVNADGNLTSRREMSWTNRANVLFINQPIGIGFSALANRSAAATSLHAGARDLHAFLTTFTASVFPELAHRPWHFAGESMGGHWTTGYAQYILSRQQEEGGIGDLSLNIETIIAVSAYIDSSRTDVGLYDFFCDEEGGQHSLMNETACAAMAAAVPECERLGALCRDTYDRNVCAVAARECTTGVGKYFWDGVRPGGWDPYDSRNKCTEPPLCSDLNGGPAAVYLNQPWVQERLGFSQWLFELIDFDLNERWTLEKHVFVPTTRELTWLLDNTDVRVLFVNGNNDIIVNTPGQLRLLDEQPWKRQAWFRNQRLHEWYHSSGKLNESFGTKGGKWKGNYRLSIFTVDEAGHMSPADQPTALEAVVGSWISRDWYRSWLSSD